MISSPLPLPEGWSVEEEVLDTITIEGIVLHRAGIAVRSPNGEIITGSSAGLDGDVAPRAWFELLERIATCEAFARPRAWPKREPDGGVIGTGDGDALLPTSADPARYRPARSNGVALHDSWQQAAAAAQRELVERHRILQAWYGHERPERVALPAGWPLEALTTHEWRAFAFEEIAPAPWSEGIFVHGVFGVPRREDAPFVIGWGADETATGSLARARDEAAQMLAFLWGEEIPSVEPTPLPHAAAHLERVLFPGHRDSLLAWLAGAHTRFGASPVDRLPHPRAAAAVELVDLTPSWLEGRFRVARADHPAATALVFGDAPAAAHLPSALRLHPIA